MDTDEVKYRIRSIRYRLCQMCSGDDTSQYKKTCRRKNMPHDCKIQSQIDAIEDELMLYATKVDE